MPIPPHNSFATAEDLGNADGGITTFDVLDSGTAYSAFYRWAPPYNTFEASFFAWGGIPDAGYQPYLKIYDSSQNLLFSSVGAGNLAVKLAVLAIAQANDFLYIEIVPNGNFDPSVYVFQFQAQRKRPLTQPTIFVPDDSSPDTPATLLSTQGSLTSMDSVPNFPHGEQGDILHGAVKVILMRDDEDNQLKLFSVGGGFSQLATIAPPDADAIISTNRQRQTFFVTGDVGANLEVDEIDATGAVIDTTVLAGLGTANPSAAAASNDGSTLYYALDAVGSAILRADLGGGGALSNLTAGLTGYYISEIKVLDDDTILAMYSSTVDNERVFARRFGISGTILNTYDFGDEDLHRFPAGTRPRLALDPDEGIFWVWTHPQPDGISRYQRIRASDGTILLTVEFQEYETGIFNGDQTATPLTLTGPSFSCPFFIVPQLVFIDESPACPCPPAHCECPTTGGPGGGSPSDGPIPTSTGPVLPPELPIGPLDILSDPYWEFLCEGGGQVPFAADPVDAESWVS